MNTYKTVREFAFDELVEKRSRFIGYCKPVKTQDEAIAFINEIKTKHWDARHNVYAYVIRDEGISRYSDDNEPQGTAGIPVLDAIRKRNITDCVVVVTRYFGGVLLGAGGLVRAYTHGCAIALDAAQVSVMEKTYRVLFDVPYPLWDKFNYALQSLPVLLENADFQASVDATLMIRETDLETVCAKLTSLTDGKVDYLQTDELFYPWPEE